MYSFEPSDEQKMLIDAARKFAAKELQSRLREGDQKCELPPRITEAGWELGLLPASIPETYGGFGERSAITGVLAAEELAWGDLAGALALTAPNLIAFPVLLCGSPEQKEKILPRFCSESYVPGSSALMEPRYNFDPNALATTAIRSNGNYLLSGAKCNVLYAAEAEWMLVYAGLDGKTEAFLASRDTPGLVVKEREQNMGMKALPLYFVEFKECAIPASQRLDAISTCS
jgi:alkylation response protein AidB-like acyl-CoA dehydrogenase